VLVTGRCSWLAIRCDLKKRRAGKQVASPGTDDAHAHEPPLSLFFFSFFLLCSRDTDIRNTNNVSTPSDIISVCIHTFEGRV
jgi:hypothetical protein